MWKWILGGVAVLFFLTRKSGSTPMPGTVGPTVTEADQVAMATTSAAIINYAEKYYADAQGMDIHFSIELREGLYTLVSETEKTAFAAAKTLAELLAQIKAQWILGT